MKVSIEQTYRFNSITNEFIETFSLSPKNKELLDENRQIKSIFFHIVDKYSIGFSEKVIINDFQIQRFYKEEFSKPSNIIYEFDYLPTVSKYNCNRCVHYTKNGFCYLRGIKTKKYKNCSMYTEKANINNIKVTMI